MKIRLDPLDKLFSKYIRLRDKGICQRCGKYLGLTSGLQCSHFIKRRYKATRWDEDNCVALCFGCHQHFEENHDVYKGFMMVRLGEKFDLLQARMRERQKPDRNGLMLYYREKIKELEI